MRACEPCRKGKLGCDHKAPFCGRCVRMQRTDQCIYHPNPMKGKSVRKRPRSPVEQQEQQPAPELSAEAMRVVNQLRQPQLDQDPQLPSPGGSISPSSPVSFQANQASDNTPQKVNPETHHQFHDYVAPRLPNVDQWKTSTYPRSARYNGPTSFSAVFSENRTNDGDLMDIDENTRKHPGAWPFGQPLRKSLFLSSPSSTRFQLPSSHFFIYTLFEADCTI